MSSKPQSDGEPVSKATYSHAEQENLQHLCDILHLFHHRNRNQHRRSLWWRHFSSFRRQVNIVTAHITRLKEQPSSHIDRSRKKVRGREVSIKISQHLNFWQKTLVSRWHNAFSQLLADGRFATLALVLSAILAQVCQIVGVTAALEDLGQVEVERVLYDFGRENWHEDSYAGSAGNAGSALWSESEDLGQVVARSSSPAGSHAILQNSSRNTPSSELKFSATKATNVSSPMDSGEVHQARKKRKTGHAIDDLFKGLG